MTICFSPSWCSNTSCVGEEKKLSANYSMRPCHSQMPKLAAFRCIILQGNSCLNKVLVPGLQRNPIGMTIEQDCANLVQLPRESLLMLLGLLVSSVLTNSPVKADSSPASEQAEKRLSD